MPRKKKEKSSNEDINAIDFIQNKNEEINPVDIVPTYDLEEMSLSEIMEEKKILSNKQRVLSLYLSGEKLKQSKIIIDNMRLVLDRTTEALLQDNPNAMAIKLYAEAYEKMVRSMNMIAREDSSDKSGTATRIYLEIRNG